MKLQRRGENGCRNNNTAEQHRRERNAIVHIQKYFFTKRVCAHCPSNYFCVQGRGADGKKNNTAEQHRREGNVIVHAQRHFLTEMGVCTLSVDLFFRIKKRKTTDGKQQEHSRATQTGRKCNCPYPKVFLYIEGCVHISVDFRGFGNYCSIIFNIISTF